MSTAKMSTYKYVSSNLEQKTLGIADTKRIESKSAYSFTTPKNTR